MVSSYEKIQKSNRTKFTSDPSDKKEEKQKQKTREQQRKNKRQWD